MKDSSTYVVIMCFQLIAAGMLIAGQKKDRIVTVSTVCLPDDSRYKTGEHVADMIKETGERLRHDLIVVPLTPFIAYREGHEKADLKTFSDMARLYNTYLAIALKEQTEEGRSFFTSILLGRRGQMVGKYRKSHALPDDEISLGDDLPVFETDFGVLGFSIGTDFYWPKGFSEIKVYDTDFARIGVHLCGDLYTGEIDRVLALKGAEIIFDPSHHWGADGYNNELLLRARAIDNGCWVACAHGNSSDPGLRSLVIDPYGYVMAASHFQKEGAVFVDIDFDQKKVYYSGRKAKQRKPGKSGVGAHINGDLPQQHLGWRDMMFSRRRPELYTIIPTVNDVILKYR